MNRTTLTILTAIYTVLSIYSDLRAGEIVRFKRNLFDLKATTENRIMEDRDGFIWAGTNIRGLFRYDGYELKKIKSKLINITASILEDHQGKIWIASVSGGIASYNKTSNSWTYYQHDPEVNSISSNNISRNPQAFFLDKRGDIWVGTKGQGLNYYNQVQKKWTHFKHDAEDRNSLSDNTVNAIVEDNHGRLWIGTNHGLNRFDRKTGEWIRYFEDSKAKNSISDNWVNSILVDSENIIWIGTQKGGLAKFNSKNEKWTIYKNDPDNPQSLYSNGIWDLYEDRSGKIWITHGVVDLDRGLERFDKKNGIFEHFNSNPQDPNSISSNLIASVFETSSGLLLVQNHSGTVDLAIRKKTEFTQLSHDPLNTNSLSSKFVLTFIDAGKYIWIGADKLTRYNRETHNFTRYQKTSTALFKDSTGNCWRGGMNELEMFDCDSGTIRKLFSYDENNPSSMMRGKYIKYIIEDNEDQNIMWVSVLNGGLERFNKTTGVFQHFKPIPGDPRSLSHNIITSMFDDGEGYLWVTTFGEGLDVFEKKSGQVIKRYRHDPANPQSIVSNSLYEVVKDSNGTLWMTSKDGFSRFDQKTDKFKNYTEATGYPFVVCASMLEDDNGNFWIVTGNAGLVKFNPITEKYKTYTQSDGLQGSPFFWNSSLKTTDGQLWFGGGSGASGFYPENLTDNTDIPRIHLTSFKQGGKEIDLGMAPEKLKGITLDWQTNFFEFQFAALNFIRPEKNQFAFMLEGRDKNWFYSGTTPVGRYTGLDAGTYTLRLKGSNNDGLWNEEGTAIKINILPPFWKSWWFAAIGIFLFVLFVLVVVFYVIKLKSEISVRKLAEKHLHDRESLLAAFTDALPDISFIYDEDGKYVEIYSSQEELLYDQAKKLLGHNIHDVLPAESADGIHRIIRKTIETNSQQVYEYQLEVQAGKTWFQARTSPISEKIDGKKAIVWLTHNITNRKQAEDQIKGSLKEKEILLQEIHHRVKNNMQIIASLLKLQANSIEDGRTKKILKESRNRVYAMSAIHETLHGSENLSEIDLKKYLLKITTSIFQSSLHDPKKVKLNNSIEEMFISINQASPLGLIINELISNSLKYAFPDERKGEISVSLKKLDNKRELTVMDNGVGMPKDLDWKNSNTLGLKLVRTLVENQLDGSIDLNNANGTKFTIKFNIES